jgi:hypothetical protein
VPSTSRTSGSLSSFASCSEKICFARDGSVGGPAADREVVPAHHDLAPVDAAGSGDEVGRREARQLAVIVVDGRPGQRPDLVKRAVVEQFRQALAHRQPARLVLAADLVGPAHPLGQFPPPAQVVQLWLPRHEHRS